MGKNKDKGKLRVVRAALRLSANPKVMFTGIDHIAALDKMSSSGQHHKYYDFEQGFILSDGTFAHRVRAYEVAKEAGQLDVGYDTYGGELLFGYMLKKDYAPGAARPAAKPVVVRAPKRVKSEPLPPELAALRPEDPEDGFSG